MSNPNLSLELLAQIAKLAQKGYSMNGITKSLELGPRQLFCWHSKGKEDAAKGETSLFSQVFRAVEESNFQRIREVEDKLYERATTPEVIINRDATGKVKDTQERPVNLESMKCYLKHNYPEKYGDQVRVDIRGVEDIIPPEQSFEEIMEEMKGVNGNG